MIFKLIFLSFAVMLTILNLVSSAPTPIVDIAASVCMILFGHLGDVIFTPLPETELMRMVNRA